MTEEIRDGEIALFDALKELMHDMPADQKKAVGTVLVFLLACAEDDRLSMNKVAELTSALGIGFSFE
ncbi:hypothetical protein [Botrimarina mediterranea]|uniref:Uncharacterized protein n=1 Tax=Botrimarina mediterranea TaxID=2528022 RepID=A0A518K788_9BACT|nr:hypothetical protein [Botrimarina mediterranea]QDV73656.1 hypothetical protein Spa11_18550 [Botrimarina mediterranea]QDV78246.1 hypothetical protein K2D_18530 [Planctomycetes bacterium K2D]